MEKTERETITVTTKSGHTYSKSYRKTKLIERVMARLTTQEKEKFQDLCDMEDKSISIKLRELIKQYIEENI